MIEVLDPAVLSPEGAVDALEAALRAGLDPDGDPPRAALAVGAGELLVMPSAAGGGAGVKLATVGGDPRVQGVYVLFDETTLAPTALIDASPLTTLRTSAVSALAIRHLAAWDAARLVVFGTGPQAAAHIAAVRAVREITDLAVVGRDERRTAAFAARHGGAPADATAVAGADIVCCCTTAREPLFDGRTVPDHAVVVAVGSHEPAAREVDEHLAGRATVVVESLDAAQREAGDVIQAIAAGTLAPAGLVPLAAVVRGDHAIDTSRPRLFKSVGMAWEDLVVARAVRLRGQTPESQFRLADG